MYPTAEHAYQFTKATFNNEAHSAAGIMQTTFSYTIKEIGNKTKNNPAWLEMEEQTLAAIVYEKAIQNSSFRQAWVK